MDQDQEMLHFAFCSSAPKKIEIGILIPY